MSGSDLRVVPASRVGWGSADPSASLGATRERVSVAGERDSAGPRRIPGDRELKELIRVDNGGWVLGRGFARVPTKAIVAVTARRSRRGDHERDLSGVTRERWPCTDGSRT